LSATLTDVDAALARAQTDMAEFASRLFELDTERDRGAAEADSLRGASAVEWQAAGDQISVMWSWYQALSQKLASFAARRRSPHINRRETEALWSDLNRPAVDLPAESMELARRCLPEDAMAAPTWTVSKLVRFMSTVLVRAAETITSVLTIRELVLPKLDEIEASLAHSEAAARAASLHIPNETVALRERLHTLRVQLAADPLAVPLDDFSELSALSAATARIRRGLDEALAELDRVDDELHRINADLCAALDDLDRARQDRTETDTKIAGCAAPPAAEDTADDTDEVLARVGELRNGLEQAGQRLATGDRAGALRLARALGPAAAQLRATTVALAASAAAPLARRRELRGRLEAYRAKAHGLGRAEDQALSQLYRTVKDTLYGAPCDLDEAERQLAEYQAGILLPTRGRA
jgi:hypothetical protein